MKNNHSSINSPGSVWGTPSDGGLYSPEVLQHGQCCAWNAQYEVLKDYGYTGTADDLVNAAYEQGIYDPVNGTAVQYMSSALEAFGVKCDVYDNGNVYDLLSAVVEGKKVIVSLDADELWAESKLGRAVEWFKDLFPVTRGANHAVVVSGFDNSDPANPTIVLTDTGTGQAAVAYPVKKFVDAWQDGNCHMIIPQEPPPAALEYVGFDRPDFHFMSVQEWVDTLPPADWSHDSYPVDLSLTDSYPSGWMDLDPTHRVSFWGDDSVDGLNNPSEFGADDNPLSGAENDLPNLVDELVC